MRNLSENLLLNDDQLNDILLIRIKLIGETQRARQNVLHLQFYIAGELVY